MKLSQLMSKKEHKMDKQDSIAFPIIRYGLIGLGTGLVQNGILTSTQADTAVGAIMTLCTVGWLVYNKKVRHKK